MTFLRSTSAAALILLHTPAFAQEAVDLIIHNALVTTQNPDQPSANAVAVTDGIITSVGDNEEILAMAGSDTQVIDGGGRRLIPGLNDNHIHAIQGGLTYNLNLQWDGLDTLSRALEMLSEQAARTPEGHWVKAIGGWSPHQFEEGRYPTLDELNAAVPNHPLIVQHAYNVAFVNQAALDHFQTINPALFQLPQTRWETDDAGNYTGVVYGEPASWAFWIMEYLVPSTTDAEAESSMRQMFHDLNRMGITSVSDAGANDAFPQPERVMAVFNNDNATVRISFMELTSDGMENVLETLTETSPIEPGENIHPHMEHGFTFESVGEVLQMDLQTMQTMSDFENFMQPIYHADPDYIREVTLRDGAALLKARIPFRIHATYNETISPVLDALEELNETIPFDGLRWSMEHAETVSEENIARIKALGGAIAVQDRMALHGDDFVNTNGLEMAMGTPPMRAMLDAGVPFSLGTDGLRASSFNPWVTMEWAVTGASVSGQIFLAEDNRLTREEALYAYTVGSAWHQYQEDEKGRIAPGQLADMALLSADYFTVPGDEIDQIHAVLTITDGETVYGEGDYAEFDRNPGPALPEWSPVNFFTPYE